MAGNASRRTEGLAVLNRWGPAAMIGLSIIGGFWLLHAMVLDGIKENVEAAERRIDGREVEDRDIRALIKDTNEAIRTEMSKLGDRIVDSNRDIGAQIIKLRDDLVATMKDGDDRLERRFDKLDEKFDILLTKIDYDVIEIPWNQAPVTVGEDGVLLNQDGKELGTIPAILRFED